MRSSGESAPLNRGSIGVHLVQTMICECLRVDKHLITVRPIGLFLENQITYKRQIARTKTQIIITVLIRYQHKTCDLLLLLLFFFVLFLFLFLFFSNLNSRLGVKTLRVKKKYAYGMGGFLNPPIP